MTEFHKEWHLVARSRPGLQAIMDDLLGKYEIPWQIQDDPSERTLYSKSQAQYR